MKYCELRRQYDRTNAQQKCVQAKVPKKTRDGVDFAILWRTAIHCAGSARV